MLCDEVTGKFYFYLVFSNIYRPSNTLVVLLSDVEIFEEKYFNSLLLNFHGALQKLVLLEPKYTQQIRILKLFMLTHKVEVNPLQKYSNKMPVKVFKGPRFNPLKFGDDTNINRKQRVAERKILSDNENEIGLD